MQHARTRRIDIHPGNDGAPPGWVEAAYYAINVYSVMNVVWGISLPLVGAGGLAVLAGYSLIHLGPKETVLRKALALPILCGLTWLAIQAAVHGESLSGDQSREFVTWMFSLIIVQMLMVRSGFIQRFAIFAFVLGLMVMPYVRFVSADGVSRMRLGGKIGISNSNDLAAWLGFCCLFFAIVGIETKRLSVRVVSAVVATTSLIIVGLTVSRGTLAAVAIGLVIAFRRTLKRGFFPVLAFSGALGIAFMAGFFDSAMESYVTRGAEETGRFDMWPIAMGRFLQAPLFGVGVSHLGTWTPKQDAVITPHNTFLSLALSAGVIPLFFFIAYWLRAARQTISSKMNAVWHPNHPFRLPLLVYLFLIAQSGENVFMQPWAIVTLSLALSVEVLRDARRVRQASTSNLFIPESRPARSTFAYQRE